MNTTTPLWEHQLDTWHSMPGIDEDTVGDNDYLLARVRHVLGYAERQGAECRASASSLTREIADALESRYLRDGLAELAKDLHVFTAAGNEMFAMLRRRFPDMRWKRDGEGFHGVEHYQTLTPGESASRCALELRLPAADIEQPRWSGWRGCLEGFTVTVRRPRVDDLRREDRLDPDLIRWLLSTAPNLPPITWSPDRYLYGDDTFKRLALAGQVYDFVHPDPAAVAAQWAHALGLGTASECEAPGRRRYVGDTGIGLVAVEWIADHERHDEYMREINARAEARAAGG